MGGGKTHQAIALILREHMPGVFMKEYAGGRVEIVAHRVSLREYLYGLLKDHDFELYSLIEDWDNVKKLIICIDSLWKVPPTIKFDLVWVNEVHEMIGSLCTLKVKAPGSGRWDVFLALQRTLLTAKRCLLTSAQDDVAVKELCDICGLTPHFQINAVSLLSHLTYELCHYDSPEIGYRRIENALCSGK